MDNRVEGKKLVLPEALEITFDDPVGEVLDFGDVVVVRLLGEKNPRNVVAVSRSGKELWRAEVLNTTAGTRPYHEIRKQGQNAWLANGDAYLIVEPATGTVLQKYFDK